MKQTEVVIIGAGQAGLAVSRLLTERGVDHVVLERGRTAERWRSRRWRSLRLLTPNWMTRLPGWRYGGPEPSGFMPATDVVRYLEAYAGSFAAPVLPDARVDMVRRAAGGFVVDSTAGSFTARGVVIATGACQQPAVPLLAAGLNPDIRQLTPDSYATPDELPPGGVLVVGASASGTQLADELHRAGRHVVLAVGRHTRATRRHRGRDYLWWLDAMRVLDRPLAPHRRRPEPSWQLVGDHRRTVDLPSLAERGVRLAGRLATVEGHTVVFDDSLPVTTAAADARFRRMLSRIDDFAEATGLDRDIEPADGAAIRRVGGPGVERIDTGEFGSVLWATGYRRRYSWLQVPVCDARGEIIQVNGGTPAPGLFVVGLPNQTRHCSSFLDGVRFDAQLVVDSLVDSVLPATGAGRAS